MDFLGGPDNDEIQKYVETLEKTIDQLSKKLNSQAEA